MGVPCAEKLEEQLTQRAGSWLFETINCSLHGLGSNMAPSACQEQTALKHTQKRQSNADPSRAGGAEGLGNWMMGRPGEQDHFL